MAQEENQAQDAAVVEGSRPARRPILQVTVVFNVTGDLKLLLSELKQAAGSGGVVREDTIEIQGDKLQFVENFISKKIKKK